MRKVVLDTNILVSALWSEQGNPYKVVEMLLFDEIVLYYTDEMFIENLSKKGIMAMAQSYQGYFLPDGRLMTNNTAKASAKFIQSYLR